MVNQYLVDLLVKRIKNNVINPLTGEPFKLEDIKIQEYKTAVEQELNTSS